MLVLNARLFIFILSPLEILHKSRHTYPFLDVVHRMGFDFNFYCVTVKTLFKLIFSDV